MIWVRIYENPVHTEVDLFVTISSVWQILKKRHVYLRPYAAEIVRQF